MLFFHKTPLGTRIKPGVNYCPGRHITIFVPFFYNRIGYSCNYDKYMVQRLSFGLRIYFKKTAPVFKVLWADQY